MNNLKEFSNKEMKVGIITDGKYGERAFKNIKRFFDTEWITVPDIPLNVMYDDNIDLDIPECDLYISYVRHPDLILELAYLKKPIILGIIPGLGLLQQAKEINSNVIGPKTMCSLLPDTGIPEINHFAAFFGIPVFKLHIDEKGIVRNVVVVRSSPCGSSKAGAEFITDKMINISNLQNYALSVCHECRAPRFGYTCDKEISGLIHLRSLMNSMELDEFSKNSFELKEFKQKIMNELSKRSIDKYHNLSA